jgi:hypothetical protein
MCLVRPECPECKVPAECAYVAWFMKGRRDLFGVAWRCTRRAWNTLVVSPIGPMEASSETCTHCGSRHSGTGRCESCGVAISELLSPSTLSRPDDELLQLARDHFALGTCRLGLTIANFVLQRDPSNGDARSLKAQFVEHLDAQRPFTGGA